MADNSEPIVKTPLAEREEKILDFWQKNNIFKKTLEKESPQGEYIFYEGPPTANGRPGIHHVEARAFKDAIPRFKTMQGFHVRRKGGWDTHGLPVELEVEKKLGLQSKKDIEKYGIAEFNKKCKESVWTYVDEWRTFTERMGYWVDLDNPYVTYDPRYMESLWSVIKTVNDKGLLYQDYRVVPWCARCGTGLSSHELAQGYQDVKDISVYVLFKITNQDEYLLAWTTTPWTLPSNLALAVGKTIMYVKIDLEGRKIWLAKDRLSTIAPDAHILEEKSGAELAGLSYEPLYDYFSAILPEKEKQKISNAYKVYGADFVTTSDGSGIVHIAPMYGADDFMLGTTHTLPKHHLVDETGKFLDVVSIAPGRFVKDPDVDILVIKDLAARNLLLKKEKVEHPYPFCWRCKTPLIYYARSSWYIKMSALRQQLLDENKKVNWEPDYIKDGRFGEWLKDVKDWAFSRERYWGTPLPVWKCQQCHQIDMIGSIDELKNKSGGAPTNEAGEIDLHRPYIDAVTWPCSCGGTYTRIPDVVDVWFDSGAMPFAQDHYPFENKNVIDGPGYPADYISEAIDQTRGWFYTLHAVGVLMGKGAAYKNVICLGHILDKNGKKMSKSLGNTVNPWDMMNKYGVDVLRFWMYSINQPGESKNFDEKTVEDVARKVPNLLLNIVSFYEMYADAAIAPSNKSTNLLDQWILALLAQLSQTVTQNLEYYRLLESTRALRDFIADLSQWYLRRSRDRFKGDDEADKKAALATTRYVLLEVSKLLAPFMPFLAEDLYQKVKGSDGKESVHLEQWSSLPAAHEKIRSDMSDARKVVSLALEARAKAGIKVRQPLLSLAIKNKALTENLTLIEVIKDEVNVKEVLGDTKLEHEVMLNITISPELKLEGQARELIRSLQEMRKKAKLNPLDLVKVIVTTDEVGKKLIEQFKEDIMKTAKLSDISYAKHEGEKLEVDELVFVVSLIK